jgi:hypothetical protein
LLIVAKYIQLASECHQPLDAKISAEQDTKLQGKTRINLEEQKL